MKRQPDLRARLNARYIRERDRRFPVDEWAEYTTAMLLGAYNLAKKYTRLDDMAILR
jgi:hypothetical protein